MHTGTLEERHKSGQARRKQMGRGHHAEFAAKSRLTPPLALLRRSDKGRVPKLVDLKYQRMAVSPFGYFRGAVPVMAADLSAQLNTGIEVQLCGDAHVQNLGAYAAENGSLIFDINDFDETIRGPFEWDLKRMAASLVLAGREAGNKDGECSRAVERFIATYSQMIRAFGPMPVLDLVRYQVSRFEKIAPVHAALRKAVRATPLHLVDQLMEPVSGHGEVHEDAQSDEDGAAPLDADVATGIKNAGGPGKKAPSKSAGKKKAGTPVLAPDIAVRFKIIEPTLTPVTEECNREVIASLKDYRETLQSQRKIFFDRYVPKAVTFKVVGTGSVGLRDYCVYMEGNGPGDPLFLQIKEEAKSGYAPYLSNAHIPRHDGQRVVEGQRLIQTGTDILLGYTTIAKRNYLVRRLNDHKASIELTDLDGDGLIEYAQLCGELLARGHARSGDAQEISGYVGSGAGFGEALAQFGHAYADQTDKDWAELKKAKK